MRRRRTSRLTTSPPADHRTTIMMWEQAPT
jgi:hypothetical protein